MRIYLFFVAVIMSIGACQSPKDRSSEDPKIKMASINTMVKEVAPDSNEVLVVPFDAVAEKMADTSVGLRVINFWATWCRPCVKELPYFEKARAKYAAQGVDFTLISLDFAEKLEKSVVPFVQKNDLKSNVWLLDDVDYNSWINKVDPEWGGEIPMTVIIDPSKGIKQTYPRELSYEELDRIISEALTKY